MKMDLKTIQTNFPINASLIGSYSYERDFEAHCYNDVADIDRWDYAPLDWALWYYPFVFYNEDKDIFECWFFSGQPICGYYTQDGIDYQLVTNDLDFGIEVTEPISTDKYRIPFSSVCLTPREQSIYELYKDDAYRLQLELLAYRWNPDAYDKGKIFTTYDAIKNFCTRMEDAK